jgi:hypothetical protein
VSKLMSMHAPVRRTDPITHPAWCEHGACVNDLDTDNVNHCQRLARWEAMSGDVRLEVALTQDGEHTPWNGQWLAHEVLALLHLRNLVSSYNVPCTVEHDVPIQGSVYLTAAECRRFAAELLDVADRIELAEVTR